MLNSNFFLKNSIYLIGLENVILDSSILAAINSYITLPAHGKSIITDFQNAVSFSFKDGRFSLLHSPALSNHYNISDNVDNTVPHIIKSVHMKKFDFWYKKCL